MDNTKDNRYYLDRILTDLRFIIAHTQDLDQEDLEENEVLQDSVMFRLIQISENSDKLTQDFKDRHPEIAWRALKGMRNRIVHNYGGVDIMAMGNARRIKSNIRSSLRPCFLAR